MEQHAGSESTLYLVPGTWYNEVLLLDTNYLILFFERRSKNEEVGDRTKYEVQSTKYEQDSGSYPTWHIVLRTWYNEVLLLDTGYLILILVPRTWYIVLNTSYINYNFSK